MRWFASLAAALVVAASAAAVRDVEPLPPGRYPDTQPSFSPYGGHVAFLRGGDLLVMRSDGSAQRKLAADSFAWSPDGTRLALGREGAIMLANGDGSARRRVAEGWSFAWSPDGRELAFGRDYLYVLDVGSGAVRQVSGEDGECTSCGKEDRDPAWSPDGTRIAFVRSRASSSFYAYTALWIARADGTAAGRLTYNASGRLRWAPGGNWLAFLAPSADEDEERTYLHTFDLTTGRQYTVDSAQWFEWSPSGTRLAVAETPGGVVTLSPDGTRRVFLSDLFDGAAWSPDGRLAFSKGAALVVADADGRHVERIDLGARPSFAATGALAYARDSCGAAQGIYVRDGAGRRPHRLTTGCVIAGSNEAEELAGSAAADTILARGGDDVVRGGAGRDRLDGGGNPDRLFGGPGDDVVLAVDGWRDAVDCGLGRDRVRADAVDEVSPTCEVVVRTTAGG